MGKAETTKNKRDTKETLQFFDTTLQAQFKNDQIRKPNRIGDPQNVIPSIMEEFVIFLSKEEVFKTEGIFRTTASSKSVTKLKMDIEKCKKII
jgi:hypothetical protein